MQFGILGPVRAWGDDGALLDLKGPRHRAVLARLLVARGRMVPVTTLVADLWLDPPADPVGSIRTFVAALRRGLEPNRLSRSPSRLLVTEGRGYALHTGTETVDAWQFVETVNTAALHAPAVRIELVHAALKTWRGPVLADVADQDWAAAEIGRLTENRLRAIELVADAQLELGRAAEAVAELEAHVADHPWREEGWRLLAVALYRSGRQPEALETLRRARTELQQQLGLEPGVMLQQLELDILRQSGTLDLPGTAAEIGWAAAADTLASTGGRTRLRSTVDVLRNLAVSGGRGLEAAQSQRLTTIVAAEELGDPQLTAQVIGAYDVPAIWSRSDDPAGAALVVAAAERALTALGPDAAPALRARLLATIALESRGVNTSRASEAARLADEAAHELADPALMVFALNARFMQSFAPAGRSADRLRIGAELIEMSHRHALVTAELLGRLICLQSYCAVADLAAADAHAEAADRIAADYESPLVGVFTSWYAVLRALINGATADEIEDGYRGAAIPLAGSGMPGMARGLLGLAILGVRLHHGHPVPTDPEIDWGPYRPWVQPLLLLAQGERAAAGAAVASYVDPPPDHLTEFLWCVIARAAIDVSNREVMTRAIRALSPATGEWAGAGSGLITAGPVALYLQQLSHAMGR